MNTYHLLEAYIVQLTGERPEAQRIIEESIEAAIRCDIEGEKIPMFVIVTIRNKCLDYNRWKEYAPFQAAALGTSLGNLEQLKRAIREGRYLQ